jgi:mRNA interferase RelE/StbE
MELILEKSFLKELKRCPLFLQKQVDSLLESIVQATDITHVPDCSAMQGKGNKAYYRIRIGGYRIGLKYENGIIKIITIITIQSRGDIYKKFPPK